MSNDVVRVGERLACAAGERQALLEHTVEPAVLSLVRLSGLCNRTVTLNVKGATCSAAFGSLLSHNVD